NMLEASWDGATYKYDGLGRRIGKTTPTEIIQCAPSASSNNPCPNPTKSIQNVETVYHYDTSGRLISETLADGRKLRDYFYVAGQLVAVDGCISTNTPPCSGREWYHTDALGNVLARTNVNGEVTAIAQAYQPWGEVPFQPMGDLGSRRYNAKSID